MKKKLLQLTGLLILVFISNSCIAQKLYLLVGTYTGSGSKGIYVYSFDEANGNTSLISSTDTASNPSFVIFSRDGKFVYAVNETHGNDPGRVSSYSFDNKTGTLKWINSQPSRGDDPCHLALSKDDKWLTVANYSSGSAAVFPINNDGSIGENAQFIQDTGSGVNKDRQEMAHVHETVFSPDGHYVFTPDLGTDKVMIYKFEPGLKKPLVPSSPAFLKIPSGNGPRHILFSPDKRFAYVICELSGTVLAYNYKGGKFNQLQEIATHPEGYKGMIGSAELGESPDGKFLYASNRGDENTLTIFSVNPVTGKLTTVGYQDVKGIMPRHFISDPSGKYLAVANQASDNIVIFKRNAKTGLLTPLKAQIHVAKPVCLQMIKMGN
ncbi:MAG TPA: lactonase family protein [Chitinophagaceae bacterium]|nr:lactonase family protein [Chitinophagaceae bacterium]